jgi:fructose-1,6-bisphosphatase/inositol monophosphatase family enzyme
MRRSPNTNILYTLVRNVARVYIRDFGELQNLQNTNRSVNDFVQKSKKRVESMILDELTEKYSDQNYEFFFN